VTAFFDPDTRTSPRRGPDGSMCQASAVSIRPRLLLRRLGPIGGTSRVSR
jgi:hypothetical protein